MYRSSYQRGLFTLLSGLGSKPFESWEIHEKDGYVTRLFDPELKALVIELGGNNVSTTYINCPKNGKAGLGIRMPFMIMIVKNLHKYFTFEVTILDEDGVKRRFRVANFQSTTTISPTSTSMPIHLEDGWNQIHFNLPDFTRRAYNKQYTQTHHVKINANIRLRRLYFADRIYPDSELPEDYKLYFPMSSKGKNAAEAERNKENISPYTSRILAALQEKPKLADSSNFRRSSSDLRKESGSRKTLKEAQKSLQSTADEKIPSASGSRHVSKESLYKSPQARSQSTLRIASGESKTSRIPKQHKSQIVSDIGVSEQADIPEIQEVPVKDSDGRTDTSEAELIELTEHRSYSFQSAVLEGVEVINVMLDQELEKTMSSLRMSGHQTPGDNL